MALLVVPRSMPKSMVSRMCGRLLGRSGAGCGPADDDLPHLDPLAAVVDAGPEGLQHHLAGQARFVLEGEDFEGLAGVEGLPVVLLDLQAAVGEGLPAGLDVAAHLPQVGGGQVAGALVQLALGAPEAGGGGEQSAGVGPSRTVRVGVLGRGGPDVVEDGRDPVGLSGVQERRRDAELGRVPQLAERGEQPAGPVAPAGVEAHGLLRPSRTPPASHARNRTM
ncbi:hypothetical protein DF19_31945 [Streptomyces olindensis]|nr:hypothetical protein DF19_31945 [Streptomyces olindensis]